MDKRSSLPSIRYLLKLTPRTRRHLRSLLSVSSETFLSLEKAPYRGVRMGNGLHREPACEALRSRLERVGRVCRWRWPRFHRTGRAPSDLLRYAPRRLTSIGARTHTCRHFFADARFHRQGGPCAPKR